MTSAASDLAGSADSLGPAIVGPKAVRRNVHARPDAGLAAVVPSHHRPCRDPARAIAPVVSRSIEGPIHTTNYAEVRRRALKVAQRLEKDGIKLGDRVATMAWNTWRHLEVWYGILGIGAVYHTVNPRLFRRPDLLDRQSCRGSHDVRRSDVPADPGENRPRAENHRALRRADRCRAHAGDDAEERRRLRGMDRRGRRRFRLEELRRKHRGRHVLHLGHHRQSQGRALLAPLQRAAFDDGGDAGRHGRRLARCGAAGGADVPRQLLGARAHLAHAGRRHGDAGLPGSMAPRSTSCSTPTRCRSPRRCRRSG